MPTENLLRLLLLLIFVMRISLATVLCRFGSSGLVKKLNFVQTLSTRFGQDVKKLKLWQNLKLEFGQFFSAVVL